MNKRPHKVDIFINKKNVGKHSVFTLACRVTSSSRGKFDMITTLALTSTPNHKCFIARRILDLSFVTVYISCMTKRDLGSGD